MDRPTQPRKTRRNEKQPSPAIIPGGATETLSDQALIDAIKAEHEAAQTEANGILDCATRAIARAVRCGQYLIEAKRRHPGEFMWWTGVHFPEISHRTVDRYIKVANWTHVSKNLPPMQSLRQAYLLTGAITIPGMSQGDQPPPDGFKHEPRHQLEMFFGIQWPRLRQKVLDPQLEKASPEDLAVWLEYTRGPHEFYLEVERRLKKTAGL